MPQMIATSSFVFYENNAAKWKHPGDKFEATDHEERVLVIKKWARKVVESSDLDKQKRSYKRRDMTPEE